MDLKIGQIVISKAGRDKGDVFIVFDLSDDGEYAFLVDGRTRLLERPKKKKRRHIQPTHNVVEYLACAILENKFLKNSDFLTAILNFKNISTDSLNMAAREDFHG